MAHSGYCSNKQILKSAMKKYKHHPHIGFTPVMMYLEELLHYMEEYDLEYTVTEIVNLAQDNFKMIPEDDKQRYEDLAKEANSYIFD